MFKMLHQPLLSLALVCAFLTLAAVLVVWRKPDLRGVTAVFFFSALVYAASAAPAFTDQSWAPHYVYLADAFSRGRIVLEEEPPNPKENDWTYYDGKWMVSFPPAPALLMTPIALIAGTDINDVLFTLLFAALNVTLFYNLIPLVGKWLRNGFETHPAARLGLTLAFGFGTVHWWLACFGQVWFTAQILAATFMLLALQETLGRARPALAGLWLALSALSRPPVLLAAPVFVWLLADRNSFRKLLRFLIPLATAGVLMGWYNLARFGSPFELGYRYMVLEELLADIVKETGSFNISYLRTNFYHAFLNLPELQARWPFVVMDGWGLSILISTPLLFALVKVPLREKLVQAVLIGALLVAVPSMLYYNTGYLQAGYRYALDFLPLLFIALAAALRGRFNTAAWVLALLSILMGLLSLANFYLLMLE